MAHQSIDELIRPRAEGDITLRQFLTRLDYLWQSGDVTEEEYARARREAGVSVAADKRRSRASTAVALDAIGWISIAIGLVPFMLVLGDLLLILEATQIGLPAIIGGIVFISFAALIDYVFYIHQDVRAIRDKLS